MGRWSHLSNNWVVENIENALETWNQKLAEIWRLLSESPTEFKGGGIWSVMVDINGALKAVGYALLVLFFLVGIMRQFNSFQEIKRPEQVLKLFIRFVLAKAAVTWGLDLMMAMFTIVQGMISKIMTASGIGGTEGIHLPQNMIETIENLWLLGKHSFVGGHTDWRPARMGTVFCHDSYSIRAIFPLIYLHGNFPRFRCPHLRVRRPATLENPFVRSFAAGMSRRSGHCTCLYNLFVVRHVPAVPFRLMRRRLLRYGHISVSYCSTCLF